MNLSVSLLDPVLYDAKRTYWRSPFLFTVSKSPPVPSPLCQASYTFLSLRDCFEVLFGATIALPTGHAPCPGRCWERSHQRHQERRNVCRVHSDESVPHACETLGTTKELAVPRSCYQVSSRACCLQSKLRCITSESPPILISTSL